MVKNIAVVLFGLIIIFSCGNKKEYTIDKTILGSFGAKHRDGYIYRIKLHKEKISKDSTHISDFVSIIESNIVMFAFGFMSREQTIPEAKVFQEKAYAMDSLNSRVQEMAGILHFMDSEWEASEKAFKKSLEINPENLQARHWYTLLLMALKRTDEGFAQSTIVHQMDKTGNFLVARASIFYFLEDFEKMKPLMHKSLEKDSLSPWTLDWLGMAYNGLEEHDDALETYFKAFNTLR